MNGKLNCTCLICRMESALTADFRAEESIQQYRKAVSQNVVLSAFPTIEVLVHHLHSLGSNEHPSVSSDEVLLELLASRDSLQSEFKRDLLLLIFVPTFHKTSRQISLGFPNLEREDIAQHLITVSLAMLNSDYVLRLKSHVAFTFARQLRRSMFRWALREARYDSGRESVERLTSDVLAASSPNMDFELSLYQFLDQCRSNGQLSDKEYEQLVLFKIQGVPSEVFAAAEGLSEIAFRHRMQRVVDRLRRLAQQLLASQSSAPNRNETQSQRALGLISAA